MKEQLNTITDLEIAINHTPWYCFKEISRLRGMIEEQYQLMTQQMNNKTVQTMEEKKKIQNPLAFPMYNELGEIAEPGMTLRDYFAAKAMQVLLEHALINNGDSDERISENAYNVADAMLNQRTKQ